MFDYLMLSHQKPYSISNNSDRLTSSAMTAILLGFLVLKSLIIPIIPQISPTKDNNTTIGATRVLRTNSIVLCNASSPVGNGKINLVKRRPMGIYMTTRIAPIIDTLFVSLSFENHSKFMQNNWALKYLFFSKGAFHGL